VQWRSWVIGQEQSAEAGVKVVLRGSEPGWRRSRTGGKLRRMLTGTCLCRGVRYEITGALGPVALCHCSMCRKASGSAFASNASVAADDFHLRAGADLVQAYESSPGKCRHFCRVCGSALWATDPRMAGWVRIRLGSLDDDPGARPALHYAVESKAPWFEITDDLPRVESLAAD
jgi:hypothetical protein